MLPPCISFICKIYIHTLTHFRNLQNHFVKYIYIYKYIDMCACISLPKSGVVAADSFTTIRYIYATIDPLRPIPNSQLKP